MERVGDRLSTLVDETSGTASVDDVFTALASEQRRRCVVVLHHVESPIRPLALARRIAVVTDCPDDRTAERIHADLYHSHLPVLEDAEIVASDDQTLVELTELGAELARALDRSFDE